MKKIIISLLVITLVFTGAIYANNKKSMSSNILNVDFLYGIDQLTQDEYISKLKELDSVGTTFVSGDYEINSRKVDISKINGLSEKDAIEAAKYNIKKTKAIKKLAKDFSINEESEETILEYITYMGSKMDEKEIEILLLISGFSSFDEYKNSPDTISATKYMLLDRSFKEKQIKLAKANNPKLSENEVIELGMKESKKILKKYVDEEN